ncbi:oligosaccharide flippase family protein [Aureimonas sp. AU40]|uniref:oligosaccharide flippase family protein n=1 Tax=Aureimonas sp. AU40 TaxID=1637747 RepID=UPI00078084E7|nr:oligosaccharide flippase family protein [Aureimonas sp. AU40]
MTKHAIIYLLAFAAPGLVGFVSFGIYTRVLRPEDYAVYSVGVSLAYLIGTVLYGWLRFALGRYQSEAPRTDFMPFTLRAFGALTVLAIPAIAVAVLLFLPDLPVLALAAILAMTAAQALFDITQEVRRARHESAAFARLSIARSLVSFSLGTSAALLFASGSAVVAGIAAGFALVSLLSLHRLLAPGRGVRPQSDVIRRFWRYGLPLSLSGLVFAGNATLARLIVGWMLGAAAAGHFGAALDVTSQLTGIVASAVAAIVGPMAIRAYADQGRAGSSTQLATGAELFLAAMVPTVVGLMIVAPVFGEVVAGKEFEAEIALLLPLLALSRGLNAFAQFYLHIGFQIVERPLRQVACGAVTLATNLVASVILIGQFGVLGAAYGIVIGDVTGVAVSILLLKPVFPMPIPARSLARVGLCALVMLAACLPVLNGLSLPASRLLGLTVVTGAVAYLLAALALDVAGARSDFLPQAVRRLRGALGS